LWHYSFCPYVRVKLIYLKDLAFNHYQMKDN